MKEIFKDIPGYENIYQISNFGNVYSIKRNIIRKPKINKDGYYYLFLNKGGKAKGFVLHRLVAETFLDKNNFKKMFFENDINEPLLVNHIDENKLNNMVNNLEWCTLRYNINYSKGHYKKDFKKMLNKEKEIIKYLNNNDVNKKTKEDILKIINS